MITVYVITDPSGKPCKKLASFKTQKEATAFQHGYAKGLFDEVVRRSVKQWRKNKI